MSIKKISFLSGYNNTSYGKIWIPSNQSLLAKWSLFINNTNMTQTTSAGNIWIAIVSKDDKLNSDPSTNNDKPNYSFSCNLHTFVCCDGSTVNMLNSAKMIIFRFH